ARQLEAFERLVGRPPTHVDSHHHVHRRGEVASIARELVSALGVPLREQGPVRYVGGFYGQWEWRVTDLEHIGPEFLIWILRNEVDEGWTEIGCHPGFVTEDFSSVYLAEREVEVATLTDRRVQAEIEALGIRLASYAELARGHDSED
ncbi:MAG: ChbG/HpnK family deacetylase, partial [Actinobacteria bacterium]